MKNYPGVNRIPVPDLPNGRVVKKVPQPFQRPSISIGRSAQDKRDWRSIPAHALKPGDTIPGLGTLYSVEENLSTPEAGSGLAADAVADQISWTVTVEGGLHNRRTYPGDHTVWAFTTAAGA